MEVLFYEEVFIFDAGGGIGTGAYGLRRFWRTIWQRRRRLRRGKSVRGGQKPVREIRRHLRRPQRFPL